MSALIAVVLGVALVVGLFVVGIGVLVLQSAGLPTRPPAAPSPAADAVPRAPETSRPLGVERSEGAVLRLRPPWSEMGLPASPGAITYQDDRRLTLRQPGATSKIAPSFHEALIAAGWERREVLDLSGAYSGKYAADNRVLDLLVADSADGVVAALTLKRVADPAPAPPPTTVAYGTEGENALNERWGPLLPDEPRHIIAQTPAMLTMDVQGSPAEVGARYEGALLSHGWTASAELAMMGESGGGVYSREGGTLSMGVSPSFLGGEGTSLTLACNDCD